MLLPQIKREEGAHLQQKFDRPPYEGHKVVDIQEHIDDLFELFHGFKKRLDPCEVHHLFLVALMILNPTNDNLQLSEVKTGCQNVASRDVVSKRQTPGLTALGLASDRYRCWRWHTSARELHCTSSNSLRVRWFLKLVSVLLKPSRKLVIVLCGIHEGDQKH